MEAAVVVAAGNFHILDMRHKHTWQDLEGDEHSRMDRILGDIHNSHHSIDSAPAESGTKIQQRIPITFLSNRKLEIAINRYKNTCLFAGLRPHESLMF